MMLKVITIWKNKDRITKSNRLTSRVIMLVKLLPSEVIKNSHERELLFFQLSIFSTK